jgi:hypothetical protein
MDGNWHPHCQSKFEFFKDKIALQSLMPTENEDVGYEECGRDLLEAIKITEMLNHSARGFKML